MKFKMSVKSVILNIPLLLISVLFVVTNAALHFNVYNKKYIEDSCLSRESFEYVLDDSGSDSAIKIGATSYSWFSNNRNCTIEINPPEGKGVILRVDSMYFGTKILSQCSDFVQVFGDGGNSTKLCGFLTESSVFVTKGKMKLQYYTSPRKTFIPGVGFILVATAYKKDNGFCDEDQFTCATGQCIWKGFTCDGMENCPDASDEKAFCVDVGSFTMRPLEWDWNNIYPTSNIATYRKSFNMTISAAIAAAVLILVIGLIRLFIHYQCAQTRRREIIRGIIINRARSTFTQQNNGRAPPPPYTSLVNESVVGCSVPSSPPEYSTVVRDGSSVVNGAMANVNSAFGTKSQTKVDQAVSEPPPPYEP